MLSLDPQKTVEKLLSEVLRFPVLFVELVTAPTSFFAELQNLGEERQQALLRAAFSFAVVSVTIGAAVGGYLELASGPQIFDLQAIITVFFMWFVAALILHPFLKLFRAKGTVFQTVAVFVFVASALHIIWVPVFAIISHFVSETRVVLTYDYVVSFSVGSSGRDSGEYIDQAHRIRDFTESYILEREPDKDGTVLLPVEEPLNNDRLTDGLNLDDVAGTRVAAEQSPFALPNRQEEAVLGPHSTPLLQAVLFLYLTTHFYYLAKGFSAVHGRSWAYWFALAYIGPAVGLVVLMLLVLLVVVSFT